MQKAPEKLNLAEAEYFAHPAVNRSSLFWMSKSPAHYRYFRENPIPETDSFLFGKAFHCAVLEPERFERDYVILPHLDLRTKKGKERYAELADCGKHLVSEQAFGAILRMQENVMNNPYARSLLAGEHEISYFFEDDLTGIRCKVRPDCRKDYKNTSVIVDLKTCTNADTDSFTKDCIKYGYDLQVAMYKTGVEAYEGREHKFVFIAVEKIPPYTVNILEADDLIAKKGFDDFRLYIGMLKECMTTGNWYGYTGRDGKPNVLALPLWLSKEYE